MNPESSSSLHSFPGGLKLNASKSAQTSQPIAHLPLPQQVWIPLRQHRGLPATPAVNVGDQVKAGDLIGRADGVLSANVHASISGRIDSIAPHVLAHPSGLSDVCISIIADAEQKVRPSLKTDYDYHLEDPNVLRLRVAEAGIVGLGGAVFPTALKLAAEADRKLHTLILNGAECEPYISCDEMLMRERAPELLQGVQMMLHVLQINNAWIAIEEANSDAINAIASAISDLGDDRIQLRVVYSRYPEGGERQLIQVLSGKEVPSEGLPVDIGYLCHNVGTAYAIYDAFKNGRALTSRIVTVCGAGVRTPQNLQVPLGTPVSKLIEFCGGYTEGQHRLILGGPMMGFTLQSDNVPVDKATNCVLVLPDIETRQNHPVMPCIRCGDCADACPASLLPQQLYAYARNQQLNNLERLHINDCIECGCCDYVCPSNLPLAETFRYAKDELWNRDVRVSRAELAHKRFDNRELRLTQLQDKRQQARALRQQAAQDTSNQKSAIEEAVARAKARKQEKSRDDKP